MLDDRYGRSSRPRWMFPLVATALIAMAIVWSVWAALDNTDKPISAQLFGYEVRSDHEIAVTVEVDRVAGGAAVCEVNAQSIDHAIVGEHQIAVPDSDKKTTLIKATFKTERRAVAAELKGCVLAP